MHISGALVKYLFLILLLAILPVVKGIQKDSKIGKMPILSPLIYNAISKNVKSSYNAFY